MIADERREQLITRLKTTPIIQVVCEKTGVSRATYYRWRKEDPEFAKATDEALAESSGLINDLAEAQLISAIRDKNLTAIIFWLKHHHEQYGNKLEIRGSLSHSVADLTEEQKTLVEKALSLASLKSLNHDDEPDTDPDHS